MLVRFRSYLDSLLEPVAFVYPDAFGGSVANFRQGTMYRSGHAALRSRMAVLYVGCREGLGMVRVDAAIREGHMVRRIGLAMLTLVIGSVACTQGKEAAPALGRVDMALVAAGSGGTIYRLPDGTSLILANDEFFEPFSLDGGASSLTVNVPPNPYEAELINIHGYTTEWPLVRENADGSTDTVQATLKPIPSIAVAENQTTPLIIEFHVAGADVVTFTHGSVQIAVEVGEADGIRIVAPSLITTFSGVQAAPSELAARLQSGATGGSIAVTAQRIGPWFVAASTSVCAMAQVRMEAMGPSAFVDQVAEARRDSPLTVCLVQDTSTTGGVSTLTTRSGAATTPLLADLGNRQFRVTVQVNVRVDGVFYDGTTLDLRALKANPPAAIDVFTRIRGTAVDETAPLEDWYLSLSQGDGTVSFGAL